MPRGRIKPAPTPARDRLRFRRLLHRGCDRAISLPTNLAFTAGIFLCLLYGLAHDDCPLVERRHPFALAGVIVALKPRHGLTP